MISTYNPKIPISTRARDILKLNRSPTPCPSRVQAFKGIAIYFMNTQIEAQPFNSWVTNCDSQPISTTFGSNRIKNSFLVTNQNK